MRPRTLVAGIAAAATLAAPTAAAAHERSTPGTVRAHIGAAEQALERVAELVADRDGASAAVAFARNRVETRRAQAEARRIEKRSAARGARALIAVAGLHDRNGEEYAEMVGDATGSMQLLAAKATAASMTGRDRALAELQRLTAELPEPARAAISRAIAAIAADARADIDALASTLAAGVPVDVAPWIELAIGQATAGLATAVAHLEALLPQLPAPAQAPVQAALDRVAGVMEHVSGILRGLFGAGGSAKAGGSGLPVPSLPIPIRIPAGPLG